MMYTLRNLTESLPNLPNAHQTYTLSGDITLLHLKHVTQHKTQIPLTDQLLFLGLTLLTDDHKPLSELGVTDGSTIDLHRKLPATSPPFDVPVASPDGTVIATIPSVDPFDIIAALKNGIERLTGVRPARQTLRIHNVDLRDEDRMWDFSAAEPGPGTIVTMIERERGRGTFVYKVRLVDEWSEKELGQVEVETWDKVYCLQAVVRRSPEMMRGMRFMKILFRGMRLVGDEMMGELGAGEGAVFHVSLRLFDF